MLVSALVTFVVDLQTGSKVLALIGAMMAAAIIWSTWFCLHQPPWKSNCFRIGASPFGTGLSGLFGDALIGSTVTSLNRIPIPGFELIPIFEVPSLIRIGWSTYLIFW